MSPQTVITRLIKNCFPRMRGDEPMLNDDNIPTWVFSPHARG